MLDVFWGGDDGIIGLGVSSFPYLLGLVIVSFFLLIF